MIGEGVGRKRVSVLVVVERVEVEPVEDRAEMQNSVLDYTRTDTHNSMSAYGEIVADLLR